MLSLNRHMWSALTVFVILVPSPAAAQTVATSFAELRPVLKKDGTAPQIKARDSLWNGALIGAAVGTGLAMWDYLIDPSEPGNAAVFTVSIGLGTAIGAGIDALLNRSGKSLSPSPRQTRRVMLSPVLGKHRQGALVSVRF